MYEEAGQGDESAKTMRKKLIVICFLIVCVAVFTFMTYRGNNDGTLIEEVPLEEGQSEIVPITKINSQLNSTELSSLLEDISYFAEQTMNEYATTQEGSIFTIDNEVKSEKEKITFSGYFNKNNDSIDIEVIKRPNDRLKVSIINKVNKASIDSQLPSNLPYHDFIAKLPINKDLYLIEYSKPNIINVTLFVRDPVLYDSILREVRDSIGSLYMPRVVLNTTFPTESFN